MSVAYLRDYVIFNLISDHTEYEYDIVHGTLNT